jgi:hypothetical protein
MTNEAWLNLAAFAPLSPGQVRQLKSMDSATRKEVEPVFYSSNQDAARVRDALEGKMSARQVGSQ